MEVHVNIIDDYAQMLRKRLVKLGYNEDSVNRIEDNYILILSYFGALRRLVSRVPRVVLKAKAFACPPKHHKALAEIERKIKSGENVNPYLSCKASQLRYSDDLLNDWKIQHLHLGKEYAEGKLKGKIKRTTEVLYVFFTEDSAYFITIDNHDPDTFAKQELLHILHDNWPEVLKPYKDHGLDIRSVIPGDLTNKHRFDLRKAGYNLGVDVMPDGTAYVLIGGGRMTSGDNMMDVDFTNRLHEWAYRQTNNLHDCISEIVTELRTKHGIEVEEPVVLRLRVEGRKENRWSLRDEYGRFTIGMEGPW